MNTTIKRKVSVLFCILTLLGSAGCSSNNYPSIIKGKDFTSEDVSYIEDAFDSLPENLQDKILKENWRIILYDNELEEKFDQHIEIYAATDTRERKIYLEEKEYLLHEICHAILYDTKKRKTELVKYEGIEEEIESSDLESYYKENYEEYIVEMMSRYIKDKSALEGYPLTKYTVEEMLEEKNLKF